MRLQGLIWPRDTPAIQNRGYASYSRASRLAFIRLCCKRRASLFSSRIIARSFKTFQSRCFVSYREIDCFPDIYDPPYGLRTTGTEELFRFIVCARWPSTDILGKAAFTRHFAIRITESTALIYTHYLARWVFQVRHAPFHQRPLEGP